MFGVHVMARLTAIGAASPVARPPYRTGPAGPIAAGGRCAGGRHHESGTTVPVVLPGRRRRLASLAGGAGRGGGRGRRERRPTAASTPRRRREARSQPPAGDRSPGRVTRVAFALRTPLTVQSAGTRNAVDPPTVSYSPPGGPRRLSARADADKARAGALGGLKANVRSTIRGASDDQTREARDPVVLGISRLPIPSRLEVPLLGRAEEDSRGGSPQSLSAVKRTRRAVRG
jgi:hypothetical protein